MNMTIFKDNPRVIFLLLTVVIVACVITVYHTVAHRGEASGDEVIVRSREPFADFDWLTVDGEELSLHAMRGKVIFVNVWATWCAPCRTEIPDLNGLQRRYGGDLQIIGVANDRFGDVKRFLAEHDVAYPIVMMTDVVRSAVGDVAALPTTFVVDRRGYLVKRNVGALDRDTALHVLERLSKSVPGRERQ